MNVAPNVVVVHVSSGDYGAAWGGRASDRWFRENVVSLGCQAVRYEFKGDYYSLPNVLPLLAMPSQAELVEQIMARELPRRPAVVLGVAAT